MKAALVLAVSTLATCLAQQFGGSQQVKITDNLLSVGAAQSLSTVTWLAPMARVPVYCVASSGATYIRFACPDCNITNINETLREGAENMQPLMTGNNQYPAYKLSNFQVSKFMNGKTLSCEARFQDQQTGQERTVQATALMNIEYFDKPLITDSQGNLPLSTQTNNGGQVQGGKRFYIQRTGGTKTLRCMVDANPRASTFTWSINGQSIGTGETINVGADRIGYSIQCSARSPSTAYPEGRDSDSVRLDPWDTPRVWSNNFQQLKSQSGLFTQGNKIMLQKSVNLQCTVSGNPPPMVIWKQQVGTRTQDIRNASCTNSNIRQVNANQLNNNRNTNQPNTRTGSNNFNTNTRTNNNQLLNTKMYQSSCTIQVRSYAAAGTYWCSACNSIAQNSLFCNPEQNSPASDNLVMDVMGGPLESDVRPYVVQNNRQSPAYVFVNYCSDPPPNVPRDIYWTIGDERVNIGERKGHFMAERPERNTTFFDCYQERLVISPVTSSDEKKQYQLTIRNQYGSTRVSVPVQNMLGEQRNSAGVDVGLAVGLTLGILVLLLIILLAICWWRRLCCFAAKKSHREDKYHSNLAPEHIRSEPMAPPPKYDAPPVNGYNSEKGRNGYNPYSRQTQEGLTYAEMDLVREPARISPSQQPPTDYAHIQHSYPLKSPTNSVV